MAGTFKGTRDILADEMVLRQKLLIDLQKGFERYGFIPLDTPCLEYLDILLEKYGEEADRLIYKLNYEGSRGVGLRYDLTVPLSRVVRQYGKEWIFPFKRYQIGKVWRGETAQVKQGRLREFYQCDADIVGAKSLIADAEIIHMSHDILTGLGMDGRDFEIRVNHRKLLKAWVEYFGFNKEESRFLFRELDKLDKIGLEGVLGRLKGVGFEEKKLEGMFEVLKEKGDLLNWVKKDLVNFEDGEQGIQELEEIFGYLGELGALICFDLTLVRGLDYYTGVIYELKSTKYQHIGSLAGGGRYDHLIKLSSRESLPSVGITLGLDRIMTLLKQDDKIEKKPSLTEVLVTIFDQEGIQKSLELAMELRRAGICTEVFYEVERLKKQLRYALKKGIRFVVILGKEEWERGKISIKDLQKEKQEEVDCKNIVSYFHLQTRSSAMSI